MPPFTSTGVDFAGPLFVKSSSGEMIKSYITLFTCSVSRAIHIELVTDLRTSSFMNCLRRFSARRGTPRHIVSDNAQTFKSTSKVLHQLLSSNEVGDFLSARRITWQFNLDRAPWWGGLFERMIGSVKRCLRKVLGNARLNQDEMNTVLVEVENTINSRPLTYHDEELDLQVLTPSHLLMGRRLAALSDNVESDLDIDEESNISIISKRFLNLAKKLSHFWNRWRNEYLAGLREAHTLNKNKGNDIQKGDIVLIQEENKAKRNTWKIGRIEELIRGKDREIRGAKVRKAAKGKPELINRPIQKLFPLESGLQVNDESKEREERKNADEGSEVVEKHATRDTGSARPRRAAAQDARWKSRLVLDP